jgi:hypothetical protein
MKDEGVYLYTHWGAHRLPTDVAVALDSAAGRGRWQDPEYLARIVFDHMKGDDTTGETGFGIGTHEGDAQFVIEVNSAKQTVLHEDQFYTFEEFISTYKP